MSEPKQQVWNTSSLINKTVLMADKERLLPRDVLSLRFECTISVGAILNEFQTEDIEFLLSSENTKFNHPVVQENYISGNCKNDLYYLYQQQKFCDLLLKVGDHEIQVHKTILCARSAVFFAMFDHDMKEKQTNIIHITDLGTETVQLMVQFLYTDSIPETAWQMTSKLYCAAQKYRLADLKDKCSSLLKSQFCPSNVCEIIGFSDLYHDDDLKTASRRFICDKNTEIVGSTEWVDLEKDNPALALEILRFLHREKIKS